MDTIIDFGKKIKELREKHKLTQEQFAARIGVSKSSISFYELNKCMPESDVLANISKTFHVSTDYLLGLDKTKRTDLSGLHEKDIEIVTQLIDILKSKNQDQNIE